MKTSTSFENNITIRLGIDTLRSSPLFVTWNTVRRDGTTRLRGCIGTFTPRPVRAGIAEYALVAAFRDHRFHKISRKELPTLECG